MIPTTNPDYLEHASHLRQRKCSGGKLQKQESISIVEHNFTDGGNFLDEPKIFILRSMQESPAFRSLSRVALMVLLDFFGKRKMVATGRRTSNGRRSSGKRWVCENNGQIQFPYSEALQRGFSRVQFRDAIDELQGKGFLDITHIGRGGRKPENGAGDSTEYLLDNRWREFDATTKRAIKPPKEPRQKDSRADRGFQKYWDDHRKRTGIENGVCQKR